jgi:predicted acylesterase/phospholipase RssA
MPESRKSNYLDPIEAMELLATAKFAKNLSWRLLRYLADDALVTTLEEKKAIKLASGRIAVVTTGNLASQGGAGKPETRSRGGALFGVKPEGPSVEERSLREWTANEASKILEFPQNAFDRLLKHSRVFRDAVLPHFPPATLPTAEVILLKSRDLAEYLPALTHMLAEATADALADDEEKGAAGRVCLLRLEAPLGDSDAHRPHPSPHPLLEVRCVGSFEKPALPLAEFAYIFLDPYDRVDELTATPIRNATRRGASVAGAPAPGSPASVETPVVGSSLNETDWKKIRSLVDTKVHVSRSFRTRDVPKPKHRPEDAPPTPKHGPEDGPPALDFFAVVLDSRTARFEAGGTRDRKKTRNADEPVKSTVDRLDDGSDPGPTTRLHLNLKRLKKAFEEVRSLDEVCSILDEPNIPTTGERVGYWTTRSYFERWVRDLRYRRVGVALGGGGATGFAHCALIKRLRQEGVPIDLVSGSSFGALVGAYYCSHGLDGLDLLAEQALLYSGATSLTMLSSAFIEHLVNLSIEYRPLWDLTIPLFAVAADMATGHAVIFPGAPAANASVGFAVRASGSLPGFFAPTTAGDARYVDGGVVQMVPVKALINRGADMVIASSVLPYPRDDNSYRGPKFGGLLPPPFGDMVSKFLSEFNPGNRMLDVARGMALGMRAATAKEIDLAHASYQHSRTDVKYWEFHKAARVLAGTAQVLELDPVIPASIESYRLLNVPEPA